MDSSDLKPANAFDVTAGSVFRIAIPMTLAYLSTPIVGVVDTMVIGRLGDVALLGGIAVGAVLFDIIFTTLNFLRSGSTGLTAQALGAGNKNEIGAILLRFCLTALIAGLLFLLFRSPILDIGLKVIAPGNEVAEATALYFNIRILGSPFTLLNYAILGWYLGLGRAGTGLLLQTVLNGTNILLTAILVLIYDFGIAGAAWGTVFAEALAALLGSFMAWYELKKTDWPSFSSLFNRDRFRQMFGLNRDIMIRSLCLLFAFAFFTTQSAQTDNVTLAANAVLMNFFLVCSYFLDGMATAAEQLVGRAVGARWRPAYNQTIRLTLVIGLLLSGLLSVLLFLWGDVFIDAMTTSDAVRIQARIFLFWAALTPIAGALAFQMDGVFIGATWSRDMRNMMLLSVALYLLCFWVLSPEFGNHGLWASLLIFLSARGLTLAFMSRSRARKTFALQPPGPTMTSMP